PPFPPAFPLRFSASASPSSGFAPPSSGSASPSQAPARLLVPGPPRRPLLRPAHRGPDSAPAERPCWRAARACPSLAPLPSVRGHCAFAPPQAPSCPASPRVLSSGLVFPQPQFWAPTTIIQSLGYDRLVLQIGRGKVVPEPFSTESFTLDVYRYKDSLKEDLQKADLVISHAGRLIRSVKATEQQQQLRVQYVEPESYLYSGPMPRAYYWRASCKALNHRS
ncbi:PREDICTED: uncharacterized protein LOC104997885, partial [Bison bison bison]|uniref:UDP-N-acetylglucosamine transferase subunit ALG13 n=1 Tax=Bison bison bison TaxID=43346 RepID=A0A6P3IGU5_BISBB